MRKQNPSKGIYFLLPILCPASEVWSLASLFHLALTIALPKARQTPAISQRRTQKLRAAQRLAKVVTLTGSRHEIQVT